ncbi:hypothetical protein BS78_05G155100, partial [Paspalum vaginatum]
AAAPPSTSPPPPAAAEAIPSTTRSSHPRRLRARAHPSGPLARARIARIPGRIEPRPPNSPSDFAARVSSCSPAPLASPPPNFLLLGSGIEREREEGEGFMREAKATSLRSRRGGGGGGVVSSRSSRLL